MVLQDTERSSSTTITLSYFPHKTVTPVITAFASPIFFADSCTNLFGCFHSRTIARVAFTASSSIYPREPSQKTCSSLLENSAFRAKASSARRVCSGLLKTNNAIGARDKRRTPIKVYTALAETILVNGCAIHYTDIGRTDLICWQFNFSAWLHQE